MNEWTQAWLAYTPKKPCGSAPYLASVTVEGFDPADPIIANALAELRRGAAGMLDVNVADGPADTGLLIKKDTSLPLEGYTLQAESSRLTMTAADPAGALYGVFHILRLVGTEQPLSGLDLCEAPDNPLRMYNHWDNMDGSIERGYSGRSFFFENDQVLVNDRTRDYCRLVASVGINGVVINNVNVKQAATWLIDDRYLDRVRALSDLFQSYGIRLFLSLNYAAGIEMGELDSADPLDPAVIAWWEKRIAHVYDCVPALGGFLVKADSEGRPGPFTYDRTHAQGANMLADILAPYGGILIWRCFVCNCRQDWRDYKTDRARAAYDHFMPSDGDFHDNVILQIKNGPMDFQIREPVSPLLGGLQHTNQMLEVQIAQEYTGQQIDVCYLIPLFREVLDFRTHCGGEKDTVADIVSGRRSGGRNFGMAAVCNTGNDANWTGDVLASANFYGFGRLAWRTSLTPEAIAREWICQNLSCDPAVVDTVLAILLPSREIYERYTCPLGIGWMVTPSIHYGPSVDGYEYTAWGTYHRADHLGLGVDRSHNGTGYAQQYHEPNASLYDDPDTCPEELLLFFHHVPYTRRLKSGKTLIQHIYDSHFQGYAEARELRRLWLTLEGKIDEAAFRNGAERFDRQIANAREWCDQVNSYFWRKTGIPDEQGREIW